MFSNVEVEYIHQIIFKGPIELLLRCKHARPTDFFKRKERPNKIIKLQAQQKTILILST
jgi:hypothetical protein